MQDNSEAIRSKAHERIIEEQEESLEQVLWDKIEENGYDRSRGNGGNFSFREVENVKIKRECLEERKEYELTIITRWFHASTPSNPPEKNKYRLKIQYIFENDGTVKDQIKLEYLGSQDSDPKKIHTDIKEYGDIEELNCEDQIDFIVKNVLNSGWRKLHEKLDEFYDLYH